MKINDVILHSEEKDHIFGCMKKLYSTSEVVSGEFYHYVEISLGYDEETVREGIQKFLDWDESPAIFELEKGKQHWIIKDI